jgi:RNA polymerase sigma-70 factor (ECF subfamily)
MGRNEGDRYASEGSKMLQPQEIDELVARTKRGDRESYCDVVRAFEYRVRTTVAYRCPDRYLVDDLVQEVFIFAYERLSEYQEGTNFAAWINAVARNTALAALKKQSKRAAAHKRYVERVLVDQAIEAFDEEEDDSRIAALTSCLGEMDERAREMVKMRFNAEMSLEEICEELGRSVSWGKSYFFRLRNMLRDCVRRRLAAGA